MDTVSCVTESEIKVPVSRENSLMCHYQVASKVSVLTGEYFEEECDITVAGCEPLDFRRFYGHLANYHPATNLWRFNPEHFCAGELTGKRPFITQGDANGSLYVFDGKKEYRFDSGKGFVNGQITGQFHPANIKITASRGNVKIIGKSTVSKTPDGYWWEGEIAAGDGGIKKFLTVKHHWDSKLKERHPVGDDYIITEPAAWTPYQLPIYEEKKPNGNIVVYSYEHVYRKGRLKESKYPLYSLLRSITIYNSAKDKILSSFEIEYTRVAPGAYTGVKITGSDQRVAELKYDESCRPLTHFSRVSSASSPSAPPITYAFSKSKLSKESRIVRVERPEGRFLDTGYDKGTGKVNVQRAPLGPKGEMLPLYSYVYKDKCTEVTDAEGNKTSYFFDDAKRIKQIDRYEKEKLLRRDVLDIDAATGDLLEHRVEDSQGRLCSQVQYRRDANHNAYQETVGDGDESYTIYRAFSNDGFNLITAEWDDFHKKVTYEYKPKTNLCISECTYEGDKLRKRVMRDYDDCAICIKTVVDDGDNCTYKKITEVKPRYASPCFGLPESITEKTIDLEGKEILLSKVIYTYTPFGKVDREEHYDSTNTLLYTLKNEYDKRERLSHATNALGHTTLFDYDLNNNLILIEGPRADQRKEIVYDKMDRPILLKEYDGEKVHIIEKGYDKIGKVISLKDECGNVTLFGYDACGNVTKIVHPDGSVGLKEVDPFGNILKAVDGKGYVTQKSYNFRNQVQEILHPDGSKESFSYHPNGTLKHSVDRNGAKAVVRSDIFGHPLETTIYSSTEELLKKRSATYSAFSMLSETDGKAVTTLFHYDFSGRKICEEKGTKKVCYSYDPQGRLSVTNDGVTITVKAFDLLDRVLKEEVQNCEGVLLRRLNYTYDEIGCTKVITSKGEAETGYNARGFPSYKKDPLGHLTYYTYSYDTCFEKKECNPQGVTTQTTYDFRGHEKEIKVKNAADQLIRHIEKKYDDAGNLSQEENHLYQGTSFLKTTKVQWFYGPGNRLERLLEEEGKETLYFYDAHGRLEKIIKPDKKEITRTYDELGRLKCLSAMGINYVYEYDPNDRIVQVKDLFFDTTVERSYDDLENMSSDSYGNVKITSTFDEQGRRKTLILPDKSTICYEYQGDRFAVIKRGECAYHYVKRDLEGNLVEAELPANLGKVKITRDVLGRWKEFSTAFYTSYFEEAYDPCGNLLHYTFEDSLGSRKNVYSYDDLHQLLSENEHSYLFDSLHHRLNKDGAKEDVNALGQIKKDAKQEYTYDLCGNLISDGIVTYEYDVLDRLIQITKGDICTQFTYDAFHRRLMKKINGEVIEYYLWDGENEIGSLDAYDHLQELRVLGEGLGAEIGAAVLMELKGKTYVPLHNHKGCLVTLIDIDSKQVVETYRYTSFGEELAGQGVCPWRFSSKRVEGDLIYFGRRYYSPRLGRWLTTDPKGFQDGGNLYAYVHSNPETRLDLYGLKGIFNDLASRFTRSTPQAKSHSHARERCHHYYPEYEKHCYNKSYAYRSEGISLKEMGLGVGFTNGILTSIEDCKDNEKHLANLTGGISLHMLYHASQGSPDLGEATIEIFFGKVTTAVILQIELWREFFQENPKGYFLQYCHSRGAADVRNALLHTPKWARDRIAVVAIAPACYIDSSLCLDITHYRSARDLVPYADFPGRSMCEKNTVVLQPHEEAPFFDHSFRSKTYEDVIKASFKEFHSQYAGER